MAASRRRRPQNTESTITPLRKHRKLLRDGSGAAVWPENIERVFLQGLQEYKKSTSSSPTRGRSRWRNQFLVDYLQSKGIERNKKQVASHIQVLRGMWKGQPEFSLVSSLEDDSGNERPLSLTDVRAPRSQPLPNVTLDLNFSPRFHLSASPISPDIGPSTATTSPVSEYSPTALGFSPKAPVPIRHPSSTSSLSNALGDQGTPLTDTAMISVSPPGSFLSYSVPSPNPPFKVEEMPTSVGIMPTFDWSNSPAAVNANALPLDPEPFMRNLTGQDNLGRMSYEFSISADGHSPFSFTFTPSRSDRSSEGGEVNIHLKLALPPTRDPLRYHSGSNGFRALIRPQRPVGANSNGRGRYETRVYFAGRLDQASIETSSFSARESEIDLKSELLATCRWLDDSLETRIIQTVFLPQEGLNICLVYDLDRSASCPMDAHLIQAKGCQVTIHDRLQIIQKNINHGHLGSGNMYNTTTMPVLSDVQHVPSALFGDLVYPSTPSPPNYHGCHYPVSSFSTLAAGPPMHMLY